MSKVSEILASLNKEEEIENFLSEVLTPAEIEALTKRWRILELLNQKTPQRTIAALLNVSLCKVTRGSKILSKKGSICKKFLDKGE